MQPHSARTELPRRPQSASVALRAGNERQRVNFNRSGLFLCALHVGEGIRMCRVPRRAAIDTALDHGIDLRRERGCLGSWAGRALAPAASEPNYRYPNGFASKLAPPWAVWGGRLRFSRSRRHFPRLPECRRETAPYTRSHRNPFGGRPSSGRY